MKRWEPIAYPGPDNGFGAATHRNFNQSTGERGSWLDADGYQNSIDEICAAIEAAGYTLDGALAVQLARTIQRGMNYAVATGTANAWVVAPSFAVHAYAAGRVLNIIAPATNTSTTVNANISTLGNRRIKKRDGSDPAIGDLVSGTIYATIDDGTNIRILTPLPSETVATVAATVPVSYNATWSQLLSDSVQTDITSYTTINSNLGDATFTGGILTVGPSTAGLWLAVFSGAHPSSNTEMLGQLMDAGTGGNSFAYNSSRTTTGAPFVTATGVIRRANGEKIRGQARQISGGSATCSGRISFIRLGA